MTAPSVPAPPAPSSAPEPPQPERHRAPSEDAGATGALPTACDKPWTLDVVGGNGQVVVVCAHDVRRVALTDSAAIGPSLMPALDPVRDKICACVGRLRPPAFVDLVFTAHPEEGRVSVEASAGDELDPDLGPPFVACVGAVVARFDPIASDACPDPGKVAFIYPVRLDLAP